MKYNVHLYIAARVKIEGVEAESQQEAIEKAQKGADFHGFFVEGDADVLAQWDEGPPLGALVDEEGDVDYERTEYYPLEGWKIFKQGKDVP